ncbi:hypothetical protein KIH74_22905 [Kineosporia sp. J2-2]|uniref:Uncharacterized protein n=1 Tax=Kineosporia corallincola TaxID=2835133 RepID=A0ABS5TN51_9ACTN|nr:hypothetical protein [Kineosporia corallincola]MBT0771809.1 hypothetical protein [Kineosporia corallincola]
MGINTDLILAGIGAAGASGAELAWFAPPGTTAPTNATTALTAGVNEQQTITITGSPTGGTFTLSYAGQTTAAIPYNATASAVRSALGALSTIGGTQNITVSGGPGPATPYVVTFRGALGMADLAGVTASGSFTGGTSPAIAVTQTTQGAPGFVSPGLVSEDGLSADLSNSSNDVKAYGLSAVARKIVTDETTTFKVVFLETNPISTSIYNRLPLTGDGAVYPDQNGDWTTTEGQFRAQRYACVFDLVDGPNRIRKYCPSAEVTEKDSFTIKAGEAILYGVTLTAYANSAGVSVATFHHVPALASA